MSLRERILAVLEERRGDYISGEALAGTLSVSRSAVWKAIRKLQDEGHEIDAIPSRGYCLAPGSQVLSPQSIRPYLHHNELNLLVYPEVTSTNTLAKQMAEEGAPEGTVILAETQTAGRGRRDHSFHSPPGGGIYMSMILRPAFSAQDSLCITTCAAVAVARAIENISGVDARIKWVNDVFCHGKKVCGIATEASIDLESGGLHHAVLGIGINVFPGPEPLPTALAEIVTTVFPAAPQGADVRSQLAAEVLNQFLSEYPRLTEKRFFQDYRARSMLLGQPINILRRGETIPALALDLDRDFGLLVRLADGREETLSSGEVSIRPR
ncbi:MAG: hypothetical protein H6Q61_1262 [Firmicutes bacterium]|nr:hypothetical protein [Bacillota bacterium]